MPNYVILGTGPAGIAASQAIRKRDTTASITIIGDEPYGYYSRPGLAHYLTGEIPEKNLFPYTKEELYELKMLVLNQHARAIHPLEKTVEIETGEQFSYDRLLIAVGASASRVNIPGGDLEGVVVFDNLDDARQFPKLSRNARSAIVVGGGITALEIVEGLVSRGVKTHYFLRGERYWSNVLDKTESRIVEHRLREEGVKIHFHTELAEIQGKRGKVIGVVTKNGERIKCKLAAIAIGIRPRIALASAAGLATDRGVLVDEFLQTTEPDIYAAGDVAQVFDPRLGKSVIDSLWGPAREQGHIAGLNMAGSATPYIKPVPFNVTRLAGLTTTIIGTVGRGKDDDLVGIARGDSETWRQLPDAIAAQSDFDINHLRIMVGSRHLLGAIVMGDQTLSQPLHRMISKQADITPIRNRILNTQKELGELITDFWCQWSAQHGT